MAPYVELHCKSNFSFLEGASHAHELVQQAKLLGYSGLAISDRDTLAEPIRQPKTKTCASSSAVKSTPSTGLPWSFGPPTAKATAIFADS
jgi:DNA polymerase III alpha subunit (gram-positive type)